ncbi:MAG: PQQ-binding-like beta-propeller repeat protein [Desulfurococcaceae archaeon]
MKFKIALIVFLITILLVSYIALIYWRPAEAPKKPRKIRIEPAPATRTPEPLPSDFLPMKLSWSVEKSNVRTDMFYAGGVPRRPEVVLRVNVSANIVGKLAEAIVEGDKLFLADGEGVYALNRTTGDLVWGVEVYFDSLEQRAVRGPGPIIRWRALGLWGFVKAYGIGKHLYVATSSRILSHGEEDSYLLAIDKDSGEVVWKVKLESGEGASSKSSVTSNLIVTNGRIFIGSIGPEGYVFVVSESGEILWRRSVGGNVRGLAYGDGKLFVTSEYSKKLHALNPESGELLWIYEHDSELMTPSYGSGRLIAVDSLGNMLAISTNGELLWKKPLGIGSDVNTNSYVALSSSYVYATRGLGERPRNLYILDFNGNTVGNFTLNIDEDGGTPAVSQDIVVLPVLKKNGESKVYLLWRGLHSLGEFYFAECSGSGWMPKVSIAYGEILVVACPSTLYKLSDTRKPTISSVEASYNGVLVVKAKAYDVESALYKVLLVYSINNSQWIYKEMNVTANYVTEPIGGHGLEEEVYVAEIPVEVARIELYVVAVDNVGNHEVSDVYGYETSYGEG